MASPYTKGASCTMWPFTIDHHCPLSKYVAWPSMVSDSHGIHFTITTHVSLVSPHVVGGCVDTID